MVKILNIVAKPLAFIKEPGYQSLKSYFSNRVTDVAASAIENIAVPALCKLSPLIGAMAVLTGSGLAFYIANKIIKKDLDKEISSFDPDQLLTLDSENLLAVMKIRDGRVGVESLKKAFLETADKIWDKLSDLEHYKLFELMKMCNGEVAYLVIQNSSQETADKIWDKLSDLEHDKLFELMKMCNGQGAALMMLKSSQQTADKIWDKLSYLEHDKLFKLMKMCNGLVAAYVILKSSLETANKIWVKLDSSGKMSYWK